MWCATSAANPMRTVLRSAGRGSSTPCSLKGHPYYPYIIGSHADIESAQLADVRGFFRDYYVPNNATMVIVGDFDKTRAPRRW